MRWLTLVGLALLTACGATEVQSQKLKDGSWTFTCELSMDECIRRAQEQCKNQRYRILEGTSETRLRDAPPFERAYHTSRLHLMCNDDGANVLLSLESGKDVPKSAKVCAPGETRECVGAGACKGGQACSPDGKAFSACDCGSQAAPPAPATPAPATPAPVPSPPTDAAATPAAPPVSP